MADINIYNDLDKAWKSTCRILLGEEVGELKEYEPWLRYFFPAIGQRKSYKSGKDIILAMDYYPEDANFVSLDEAEEKEVKLNINKIKDLDSILESLSELWEYTGNKVLGNSSFVESADLVTDCQYANEVVGIQSTAHSFATYDFRRGKYIFGSGEGSDGEFLIGFLGGNDIKRCFCSSVIADSSDLYLSHNCYGCQELMFSFHQVSKRHRIGNLELPKDKYLELKPKLLGEIREELKKNKQFPSLYQLVPNNGPNINIDTHTAETDDRDIRPIEKAFSSVMKILFKKDLNDISQYETWLSRRIVPLKKLMTPFGSEIYVGKHQRHRALWITPEQRSVTYDESMELSKLHIDESKAINLDNLSKWASEVCCFCIDFKSGKNMNVIDSTIVRNSSNVYKSYVSINSEYVGLDYWPMYCKYVFGSHSLSSSQFSVNCHHSYSLNRCFELDASTNCSDSYFAHNCEGLQDAMFCFNVKGKRHAIGNTELQSEQYRKIKETLVSQMADEIIKKKELKWDIFNIGCGKR